jgi:phenylpyruvate tautomerase PptA (4-oxalocrotonate tautomerase family)
MPLVNVKLIEGVFSDEQKQPIVKALAAGTPVG